LFRGDYRNRRIYERCRRDLRFDRIGRFCMEQTNERELSGRATLIKFPLRYLRGWLLILAVTAAATLFNLLQPWPMKVLVDNVFNGANLSPSVDAIVGAFPWTDNRYGLLLWVSLAGVIIFAVNSALDIILTFAWIKVGQRMVYDLLVNVFSRVQRRSLLFHTRNSVGDLLNRITGDVWGVHTLADALMFAPAHALLLSAAMLVIMLQMSVRLTLAATIVVPLITFGSLLFGGRLKRAHKERRESESRIHSHLQQTLSGIVVVQAFGQEERERGRFKEYVDAVIGAQKRNTLTGSFYNLFAGGLHSLGTGLLLYLGAHQVISGEMTTGSLLVFLSYVGTLQGQLRVFTDSYSKWQQANAGIDRLVEIVGEEGQTETAGGQRLTAVKGLVRFERVTFGYEAGRPVLDEVDFEARPGQRIAIIGRTGAGKSTLVSLIPRFFDPWSGKVTIDGKDIKDVDVYSLREHVGMVTQEAVLLPVSLAENISFGRPDAPLEDIRTAARDANADDFIGALPDGYDTVLGERGATLSGGERQRVSIARALLKNAPILILDEPTSALDARTERSLLDALDRLMHGRTTFVIAHRLSTILAADLILVLDNGQIVERGKHEELLTQQGLYASLYHTQFGSETPLRRVA
jgi:ATP-binding cassette, subfamily B, bacterial